MLAVRSMKLLPAVSLMIEASLKSSVDNNKQYPRRPIRSGNPELLHKYELITRELTRTAALVFYGRWSRWARNSSIEANRIMPSGICASIEPSEYSEEAMPSTTPDL